MSLGGDRSLDHAMAAGHRLRLQHIAGPAGQSGPTLVFLHEGLGSIPQWRDFPTLLCAAIGLPGLVYERYGHGGSDAVSLPRPDDFLKIEAEQALPDLLAACGIDRPILVGHSDGGTIALYHAALVAPPLACITLAAHVMLEATTQGGLAGVMGRWRDDPEFVARLARYHGDRTESMFRGWAETWTRESMRDWSMVDLLPRITCPVLAIQGDSDAHGSWAQVETIIDKVSGPAEAFEVPGCGHVPHLEAGPLVIDRIAGFLRNIKL
ncbi:MAG: alpha/beta hydrolase [Alphaproteobacteria bacterium]|nr:alpha/beta hydrolase [Alphaproteobacteria bacterium]MBU0798498.1 alpha/beta hydrolase [Alphaproteobacteria bacterium]MBU0888307.1 alpha/beta hydrolase [Alphaproteobacteria bacterium]MBU1812862.1 alpha/beta hydrolase [Alphaproteobacteria bacterium]